MTVTDPSTPDLSHRRLMLVHAHPDDECSGTGATMARYAAAGAAVTLVTCTLGEEGEVLVGELSHLSAAEQDALGEHRLEELAAAMEILGVTDFVRLGGDHRYRDSGMAYAADGTVGPVDNVGVGTFWRADVLEAANELVPLIRDRRPQVLITYDERGGYGHPDHIQAHRVAMYATQLAAAATYRRDLGEPWSVSRVLWTAWSEEVLREAIQLARDNGDDEFFAGVDLEQEIPGMGTKTADIECEIVGSHWAGQKRAALSAHATQVDTETGFFGHITRVPRWADEHFRVGAGVPFPVHPAQCIFEGLSD